MRTVEQVDLDLEKYANINNKVSDVINALRNEKKEILAGGVTIADTVTVAKTAIDALLKEDK